MMTHCCDAHHLLRLLSRTNSFFNATDGKDLFALVRGFMSARLSDERIGQPWSEDENELYKLLQCYRPSAISWDLLWLTMLALDARERATGQIESCNSDGF